MDELTKARRRARFEARVEAVGPFPSKLIASGGNIEGAFRAYYEDHPNPDYWALTREFVEKWPQLQQVWDRFSDVADACAHVGISYNRFAMWREALPQVAAAWKERDYDCDVCRGMAENFHPREMPTVDEPHHTDCGMHENDP